jgi:uroporphyrinogen-III synthase
MTRSIGVLRPEPGNAATADRIEARGRTALRLPLFAVRPVEWSSPDPARYDSLLLTSANAVRHGGPALTSLTQLPVHAVGPATAAAARVAGFEVMTVGDAGVEALQLPGRVLHLTGREHRARTGTDTIVVYASEALDPDLGALRDGIALIHSARAGQLLARRLTDRSRISLAAISDMAARAAGSGWRTVAVADRPADAALIDAAIRLAD